MWNRAVEGVVSVLLTAFVIGSGPAHAGSTIVFHTDRDGNSEIYAMKEDGTGQTRRTNHSCADFQPSICPNGQKIVWGSPRDHSGGVPCDPKYPDVFSMDSDGTDPENLNDLDFTYDSEADCGLIDDELVVAFASNSAGDFEIFRMNIDGSDLTQLTSNSNLEDFGPTWCGDKIVFQRHASGNPLGPGDLYIMTEWGGDQTQLTDTTGSEQQPACKPGRNQDRVLPQRRHLHDGHRRNGRGERDAGLQQQQRPDAELVAGSDQDRVLEQSRSYAR